MRRLLPEGKGEERVAVLVTHTDGQEDITFSSLYNDLTKVSCLKKFEVAAEFAMFSLSPEGDLERVFIMDGTNLTTSKFSVQPGPSSSGQVVALDYQANTVTVDALLPVSGALNGRIVIFANELHSTSYPIKGVRRSGNNSIIELGEIIPIVGQGRITGVDTPSRVVSTDTRLDRHNTVFAARHRGRRLLNEDRSAGFLISSFDRGRFNLKGVTGNLEDVFSDDNGDGRKEFWIADISPGDTFNIPSVTYLGRLEEGKYRLQIMTDVTMQLPLDTDTIWYRGVDGKWQSRKVVAGELTFRADELKDGETIILTAKPDWMILDDHYPPEVQSVQIDNRNFTPRNRIDLGSIGKAPKQLKVSFADKNPLAMDTLKVFIDGREVEKGQLQYSQKDPRSLEISLDIDDMPDGNSWE